MPGHDAEEFSIFKILKKWGADMTRDGHDDRTYGIKFTISLNYDILGILFYPYYS
jgi:hypothetical protein